MEEQFDPNSLLFVNASSSGLTCNGNQAKLFRNWQRVYVKTRLPVTFFDQRPTRRSSAQRFICSVNNEAVLKALFKIKDTDLTFARAVQVAIETEDAARVAKETVYGSKARPVHKVNRDKKKGPQQNHQQLIQKKKTKKNKTKKPAEVLQMWKGPQSSRLPLQRSQVSFL